MEQGESSAPIVGLDELIGHIRDGMKLAIPHDFNGMYSGAALSATRALIRRGVKKLHIVGIPAGGFQADLLIGAGCVATLEAGSVFMSEYGMPPRFMQAFKDGTLNMRDATCPAIHAALQAGEKRIPFIPLRGILGADVVRNRPDWRVIDNPFAKNDPVLLLPAINPDVTLIHAPMADRLGNVWIGRRRELAVAAHASTETLVTVERILDGNLMDDEHLATGTLSNVYVTAVCHQPRGAWPLSFGEFYGEDSAHMREYMDLARTAEGFQRYLERHVLEPREALA